MQDQHSEMYSEVKSAVITNGFIQVTWTLGQVSTLGAYWLRDNCHCSLCRHPGNGQKLYEIVDLPRELFPREAFLSENQILKVVWSDGHRSSYTQDWLIAHDLSPQASAARRPGVQLWRGDLASNMPVGDWPALLVDPVAELAWLERFNALGFGLLKNVPVEPGTVAEVAQALVDHPDATLLAGSTEVGLKVNKQHWRPEAIVYLGNVAELREVKTTPGAWRIGAAVPLEQVMQLVADELPDFAEVLRRFGSPPIRSTATLAGNIANGSPIGDSMPSLMALGATLVLRQGAKTRSVPLAQFYTGMKQNLLKVGEFIEAIEVPRLKAGEAFRAHKISKRFDQDISATCAAIRYRLEGGQLKDVRLAFNGLTPYPARAARLEGLLEGRRPEDITAAALDAAVAESFAPRDGLRATWAYRALVARNLVLRFIGNEQGALA